MTTKMIKSILLLLLAVLMAMPAQARKKPKYEITLTIKNGKDSVMYMGHYLAKGNQVVDTAFVDKKGRFVFSSATDTLPYGLYFFANPKGTYVEFVVYREKPFFSFETDDNDWTSNMKVKNSRQNEFFFQFHVIDGQYSKDISQHNYTMDSAAFAEYKYRKLLQLDSVKMSLIKEHPEMFLSKMMLCSKDEEPPVVSSNGDTLTANQRRNYFIEHYFDNMMLEDNALVRTPKAVFYDRVMDFYDKVLKYAPPQVIIGYMDPMLERAKAAPDVFQ